MKYSLKKRIQLQGDLVSDLDTREFHGCDNNALRRERHVTQKSTTHQENAKPKICNERYLLFIQRCIGNRGSSSKRSAEMFKAEKK